MKNDLSSIATLIVALWLVFLVDLLIPASLTQWGLVPRTASGLLGIPLMPLLHAGPTHLLGNTVSLFILLALIAGSRANLWTIVACMVVLSGTLLWLFGRPRIHIGASGLVFALISFLIVLGLLEKRPVSLAISFAVGVFYGTTLLFGLIPRWSSDISWDGHLCGVIAGVTIAYLMFRGWKIRRWKIRRWKIRGWKIRVPMIRGSSAPR